MDPVKIGSFIAYLRRRDGLTQEALGEKLGVANKTVSRWENGNYMPPVETLLLLSETFHVSLNELLAGEFLEGEAFRKAADENLREVSRRSVFSVREQTDYWRKKWLREHIALLVLLAAAAACYCVYAYAKRDVLLVSLIPILVTALYAYVRNKMLGYVEGKLLPSETPDSPS